MAGKIPFILGLGAGYVLGTRAGRAQYERIKSATQGEAVTEKVADAVKERLFGTPSTKDSDRSQPVDAGEAELRPVTPVNNEAG